MRGMPRVVVDTSVVSIIHNHDDRAPYYERRLVGRSTFISFQTLEELWYGAYKDNWGAKRRAELAKHIEQYHVVWANPDLIRLSARLRSDRRSAGRELKSADAWIASRSPSTSSQFTDRTHSGSVGRRWNIWTHHPGGQD